MRKRIFWIVVFLFCIFLACLSTNYDYDLFARLIVGENFVENGILPYKDFLSYTPTHPWYDHEWGSGVIFYLILKYLQPAGLVFFQALMMFGTTFFIVKAQKLQKHSYPASLVFIIIYLILFNSINMHLVRCQLFSFFFFALFLYLLEKYRKQNSNLIFLIPPITIFWNNVHGGVVAGLGLICLYFLGAFLENKPWKKYFVVLIASSFLLPINPYGFNYLKFLLYATTMTRKFIVEWWNIFSPRHHKNFSPFVVYILTPYLYTIYCSIKQKKVDWTKLIVLSVTLVEGFMHIKLLSLALIATSVFCYNDFCRLFRFMKNIIIKLDKTAYIVIIFFAFTIPLFSPNLPRADFNKFPLKEVEFLKINNIHGNIVVPFAFGSYVSYKLYPKNLIYMDGRYEEVYNDKEFLTLKNYELGEKNWQDIIKKYDTNILMPLKTIEVYPIILNDPDWILIFEGELCGIFVRKNYTHTQLAPTEKIIYYRKNMFNGNFGKFLKYKG